MEMKLVKSSFYSVLKSVCTLLIFIMIDFYSVGGTLFCSKEYPKMPSTQFFSSCIFLATTFCAQACYAIFSSISTGVAASIIFEAAVISRKIAGVCFDTIPKDNNGDYCQASLYANIMLCMGVSTLLFSIASFAAYYFDFGSHFKRLPFLAVFSVMTAIGCSILEDALMPCFETALELSTIMWAVIVFMLGLGIFLLEMRYPSFQLLLPCSAFAIIVVFNLVYRVLLRYSSTALYRLNLITDVNTSANKSLFSFPSLFVGNTLYFSCILNNIGNILSLTIFNMIHINVNIHPYALFTGKNININREWFTQGVSNICTCFAGYPSYFVNSTSIFFYKAGAKTRIGSIFGIAAPVILAAISPYIREYIPVPMSQIILSYLGIVFIYSYCIGIQKTINAADFCIMLGGVIFCRYINFAAGFAIVTALGAMTSLRYYLVSLENKKASKDKETASLGDGYVCVDYVLCFVTVDKFKTELEQAGDDVTVDMTNCPYIDSNGNLLLLEYAEKLNSLVIIGQPNNFYKAAFLNNSKVRFSTSSIVGHEVGLQQIA